MDASFNHYYFDPTKLCIAFDTNVVPGQIAVPSNASATGYFPYNGNALLPAGLFFNLTGHAWFVVSWMQEFLTEVDISYLETFYGIDHYGSQMIMWATNAGTVDPFHTPLSGFINGWGEHSVLLPLEIPAYSDMLATLVMFDQITRCHEPSRLYADLGDSPSWRITHHCTALQLSVWTHAQFCNMTPYSLDISTLGHYLSILRSRLSLAMNNSNVLKGVNPIMEKFYTTPSRLILGNFADTIAKLGTALWYL